MSTDLPSETAAQSGKSSNWPVSRKTLLSKASFADDEVDELPDAPGSPGSPTGAFSPSSRKSGAAKNRRQTVFDKMKSAVNVLNLTLKSPRKEKTDVYYFGSAAQAPFDRCRKDLHIPIKVHFEKSHEVRTRSDSEVNLGETSQNTRIFMDASCGPSHCCVVTDQGDLFTWGLHNSSGQLGLPLDADHNNSSSAEGDNNGINPADELEGDDNPIGRPRHVDRMTSMSLRERWQLSCGVGISAIVGRTGQQAHTWGGLSMMEMGDDYVSAIPKPLAFPHGVSLVALGGSHMLVATPEGLLFAAGNNRLAQLGLGSARILQQDKLAQVPSIRSCVAIGCGRSHSMCIAAGPKGTKHEGIKQLLAWGDSTAGKLGMGIVDCDLGNLDTTEGGNRMASDSMEDGRSVELGRSKAYETKRNVEKMEGDNPRVWSPMSVDWFLKEHLWLKRFVCGNDYNFAIASDRAEDTDGYLYSWGSGASHRLGLGDCQNQNLPCLVGKTMDWGPKGSVRIERVAAGYTHSAVIDNTGNVHTFGTCAKGGLGLGPIASTAKVPTQVHFSEQLTDRLKVVHAACGENFTVCIVKIEPVQTGRKSIARGMQDTNAEDDEQFEEYKMNVIRKLLEMHVPGDKIGSIERYVGVSKQSVHYYSSGLWPVLNQKDMVFELQDAKHYECRPNTLDQLFPEAKPSKPGEKQAADQDNTTDEQQTTSGRPKSAPPGAHRGGFTFPQVDHRGDADAQRTQASGGAGGMTHAVGASSSGSGSVGFGATRGRAEKEVNPFEEIPGPGAYGTDDRGPNMSVVQYRSPTVEFSNVQGRAPVHGSGEGSRGPGAYNVDRGIAKRSNVARAPEWNFDARKPRQTEREKEGVEAKADDIPFLRHMPNHGLVQARSPAADFMKSTVQRFPMASEALSGSDKRTSGSEVKSSLSDKGACTFSELPRFSYSMGRRSAKRRTPRQEMELNQLGEQKLKEYLEKRNSDCPTSAKRKELHQAIAKRRTLVNKEREDRILADQERRQRRLESKNLELFMQAQKDVTQAWGRWFVALVVCKSLGHRLLKRRTQWMFVVGVVWILRHVRRWRIYFVCKRLKTGTRLRIAVSIKRYTKWMKERMQLHSSGMIIKFMQLALDLGSFTKQVKTFLLKVEQLQNWIRKVLGRLGFSFTCLQGKWKRKLRERRTDALKEIISSKTDRSVLISYRDVLLRYEHIFGKKLWPLLRKVRKKNWYDLKTQYLGMGQIHELREAQTWLLGIESDQDDAYIFEVGAYVCTYEGLLTTASFEKWERTVYLSFLSHLKTEMRTGQQGMGDEALEQLAIKTIKANGGTEHFVNPASVQTNADFFNALKVLDTR